MMKVTTDLADFGMREHQMTRDLLNAWIEFGLPDDFEHDEVRVAFNMKSGLVFLTNSDYSSAVLRDGYLVSWYSSPFSGHEGTVADLVAEIDNTWNGRDIAWLEELSGERFGS